MYGNILEEELKNKVAHDWFAGLDSTQIIGKIDFCISVPTEDETLPETVSLLWAEAKAGTHKDIYESFVQLILTIGKARTFDHHLPPAYLGAFDAEKIAFLPYTDIIDVFYQNDFNWNVAPSDHETKEFRQLYGQVKADIERQILLFRFDADENELRTFIRRNFVTKKAGLSKIRINKNNFTHIYQKWVKEVKPTISIDWEAAGMEGVIDADFYLADILSEHNVSLREKLFVLLRNDKYIYNIERRLTGSIKFEEVDFSDEQQAHTLFWNRYSRPPKREYWDYIVERRDLLVPQDVRERKGSYFTPRRWVELSQQYLADELGDDWQDEYYVWDCAAGTGNLLAGLTNKYNVWASTLDAQDVKAMHELIASKRLNLLEKHVFQFDFLNDDFTKLPKPLLEIINDPEKRRKLVVYINPPYAEAGNRKVIAAGKEGEDYITKQKTNVSVKHLTYKKYLSTIGIAGRELFAQFFIRIYCEIPSCVLAEFSKLKILQAPNFRDFRKQFRAKLGRNFLVPANTFDNVKGDFPIGFFTWHLDKQILFKQTQTDVYDKNGVYVGKKNFHSCDGLKSINDWMIETRNKPNEIKIGYMSCRSHDFSNANYNFIMNDKKQMKSPRGSWVTDQNIERSVIYIAVCHCIAANWLNDRDQFLFPNENWQFDNEFQTDCLAYTLFSRQNNISIQHGTNHWIPFTEEEVDAKEKFASHFMADYISGRNRLKTEVQGELFNASEANEKRATHAKPLTFSPEAQAVMNAGRELWRYYHTMPDADPNAALYDIRLYFQGTNEKGKMNTESRDARYSELISTLRQRLKTLARKIEPKVYEYGFLLK